MIVRLSLNHKPNVYFQLSLSWYSIGKTEIGVTDHREKRT